MTKEPVPSNPLDDDSSFRVDLTEGMYAALNSRLQEELGKDFNAFAQENPNEAYEMLLSVTQGLVERAGRVTVEHDGIAASSEMDGIEAAKGMARGGVEATRADTDIEPIAVVVSVFRKPTLRDRMRSRQSSEVVSQFRVEPPNLVNY